MPPGAESYVLQRCAPPRRLLDLLAILPWYLDLLMPSVDLMPTTVIRVARLLLRTWRTHDIENTRLYRCRR